MLRLAKNIGRVNTMMNILIFLVKLHHRGRCVGDPDRVIRCIVSTSCETHTEAFVIGIRLRPAVLLTFQRLYRCFYMGMEPITNINADLIIWSEVRLR